MKVSDLSKSTNYKPWMKKTYQEVQEWIDLNEESTDGMKGLYLDENGYVSSNGLIMVGLKHLVFYENGFRMGVQFGHCKNFNLKSDSIVSLEGCPKTVEQQFITMRADKITSLEGITENSRKFTINGLISVKSFHNVHKYIKQGHFFEISDQIEDSLLGLLLIPGIRDVHIILSSTKKTPMKKVQEILNKHISGDKDVLDCQEELIKAGFKDYARL